MKIASLRIVNYKSISDLTIYFHRVLNVLTGINNCGKTTILEALALWSECFEKLIYRANRSNGAKYEKGDYVFGNNTNKYFNFENIVSVRSSYLEDIFRDRNVKNKICLSANVSIDETTFMNLSFSISCSGSSRYIIQLENDNSFDYNKFNKLFRHLPNAISTYFFSPASNIFQEENFLTDPIISDRIRQRRSYEVVRNRIYKLYHTAYFGKFQEELSYVLYDSSSLARIIFTSDSDISKDVRVVIRYKIGNEDVEKDIALLGSGTLQVIEVLLNLFSSENNAKDLNLILLDEPDSHIHRTIQKRLLDVCRRRAAAMQVVLTTHNESLIRSTALESLFHIDGKGEGEIRSLYNQELPKLGSPHFKGIYPDNISPIIRQIDGATLGIDFVNAIEADKIVFVEGENDARVLTSLYSSFVDINRKKITYWVLGGISNILDNIDFYHRMFSLIHNEVSLWSKSCLVFDRDNLTEEDVVWFQETLSSKYQLKSFSAESYTQESILLYDLEKLSLCLSRYYDIKDSASLCTELKKSEQEQMKKIRARYSDINESFIRQYRGQFLSKLSQKTNVAKIGDIELSKRLCEYYIKQPSYRLSNKSDVQDLINAALLSLGVNVQFDIEKDYYELIRTLDNSCINDEFKRMIEFLN